MNPSLNDELVGAVFGGDLEEVKSLIARGADPREGCLLHSAAEMGHKQVVEYLLDLLGNEGINSFDELSYTPLTYAAKKGHLEVAKLLLAHGADINAHNEARSGDTPLCEAVQEGLPEVVQFLLDAGADPLISGWMHITAYDRAKERAEKERSSDAATILSLVKTAANK
jgi:ankyrin repeat protein